MNSEMIDLAREAVACDGWRWMTGMRAEWRSSIRDCSAIVVGIEQGCPQMTNGHIRQDALPDLESSATLGCLLHLVREVLGDPTITTEYQHDIKKWTIQRPHCTGGFGVFATEIEALVAALKAGGDR